MIRFLTFFLALSLWASPAHADEAEPPRSPAEPSKAAPVEKPIEAPKGPRRDTNSSMATRLDWRWPKFTAYQFGLSVGQGALAVASLAIPGQSDWKESNGFDRPVRDALRLSDPEASLYARDASDVGLVLLLNQRLVDTLFVTWWYHDKGSTALQMGLIDVQTATFALGIQGFVAGIVGRERPYVGELCDQSPERESTDCQGSNRYRSYFSGHATLAFTFASLTCMHHIQLPLYGGGPGEAIPCIGAMLVAGGVSTLRIASDQHYLSDVLTGAGLGTLSGFLVPYLFHYAHDLGAVKSKPLEKAGFSNVSILPTPGGLSIGGLF